MAGEDSLLDPEIERLSERLSKDPDSLVFAPLADAYRKSGLIEEAIDILRKGMDRHPNYASAYIVLGRCYQDQKMYELARSEFEKALEVAPDNFLASRLYADVLVSLGQKEEAIKRYKHLLESDPGNVEIQEALEKFTPGDEEQKDLTSEADTSVFDFGEIDTKEADQGPTDVASMFGVGEALSEGGGEPVHEIGSVFDKTPAAPPSQPESGKRSPFDFGTIPETASREPEDKKKEEIPVFLEPTVVQDNGAHASGHDLGGLVVEEKLEEPPSEEEGLQLERSAVGIPYGEGQPPGKVDKRLAEIYFRHGFVDKAIRTYERLVEMEPSNQDYKNRLAEIRGRAEPAPGEESVFPSEILEPYSEPSGPPPPEQDPSAVPGPGGPDDNQNISLTELFKGESGDQGMGPPAESPHPSMDAEPEEEARPEEEKNSESGFNSFQSWLDGLKE